MSSALYRDISRYVPNLILERIVLFKNVSFSDTETKTITQSNNYAMANLYYASDYITINEEYLIFDFSSILVAAGGSLGLFLGFSFLQCGDFILGIFKRLYEKYFLNRL